MASRKLKIIYVLQIIFLLDSAAYQVLYELLTYATPFNSNLTLYKTSTIIMPICRWRNWGTEKFAQSQSSRFEEPGFEPRQCGFTACPSDHPVILSVYEGDHTTARRLMAEFFLKHCLLCGRHCTKSFTCIIHLIFYTTTWKVGARTEFIL